MKTMNRLLIVAFAAILASCASTVKFPVSNTLPGADITVKKSKDKSSNYVIEVTAENLADPNRLEPPKNNYSVWVVLNNGQTRNIGQLSANNNNKAVLKTITPFDVREIFITAEERGDLTYPAGTEIARTTLR
jgi:hypothetical protein